MEIDELYARLTFLAVASASLLSATALAQQTPSPNALNDCTLLTNPTQLQDCFLSRAGVGGGRFIPPRRERQDREGPLLKDEGVFEEKSGEPP